SKSRLAPLGEALAKQDLAFLEEKKLLLPARPTPDDVKAPMVARALPYEWTPLVRLGDGKSKPSNELPGKLQPVLAADRRGLVAPTGALPAIATGAGSDPAGELRKQLSQVRAAFPDEDGLVLVPELGASYGSLVAAAAAARTDDAGHPLFGALALGAHAPGTV